MRSGALTPGIDLILAPVIRPGRKLGRLGNLGNLGNLGRVRVFHVRVFDLVRSRKLGNLGQIILAYFTHIQLRHGSFMFPVHVCER